MSDHEEIEPLESWTRDDAIEADCEAAEQEAERAATTYPCRECGTPLPEPHQLCGHCYQFLET